MPLPNLSKLRQRPTGHLQNANAWLFVQRLKKDAPNRDPITTEDWRAEVREAEKDGPAPKNGWILVVDKDGVPTPEPQYLYDVEALAQHLLNGGVSPLSRLPPNEKDKWDCIKEANRIRADKVPPLGPLQRMGNELPQLGLRPVRNNNDRLHDDEFYDASRRAQTRVEEMRAFRRARLNEIAQEPRPDPERMPPYRPEERRRRMRESWGGELYPILTEGVQGRYEEWYRVLPEGATGSFLLNASLIFQVPSIADDDVLARCMTQLLALLDRLIQEAETAPPGPARRANWAAAVWRTRIDGLKAFAREGHAARTGEDQDAMTSWVDSLWQVVGVWKGQARRRTEWQGGSWLHREADIPAARAMQQLPSFRPGDEEDWQRQLDARDPGTARARREAPPRGTPEHAEWVRRTMS